MSIMPVGGWKQEPEGELIHRTPRAEQQVVVVYKEKSSSPFAKAFFGCLGVICAIWFVVFLVNFTEGFTKSFNEATNNTRAPIVDGTTSPIYDVTATKLNADYESNEPAADAKYVGKTLRVRGQVNSIEKDAWAHTYLVLQEYGPYGGSSLGVHATLTDAEAPRALNLYRWQMVTVTCSKVQRVIGIVMLGDCGVATQERPQNTGLDGRDDSY